MIPPMPDQSRRVKEGLRSSPAFQNILIRKRVRRELDAQKVLIELLGAGRPPKTSTLIRHLGWKTQKSHQVLNHAIRIGLVEAQTVVYPNGGRSRIWKVRR